MAPFPTSDYTQTTRQGVKTAIKDGGFNYESSSYGRRHSMENCLETLFFSDFFSMVRKGKSSYASRK